MLPCSGVVRGMGASLISNGPEGWHGHRDHRRGAARRRLSGAVKSRLTMHGTLLFLSDLVARRRKSPFQTVPNFIEANTAAAVGSLLALAPRAALLPPKPTSSRSTHRRTHELTSPTHDCIIDQGRNQEPNKNRKELTGTRDIESITSRNY